MATLRATLDASSSGGGGGGGAAGVGVGGTHGTSGAGAGASRALFVRVRFQCYSVGKKSTYETVTKIGESNRLFWLRRCAAAGELAPTD